MAEKLGSSSYGAGDTGGDYGDYDSHGVTRGWVRKQVGMANATMMDLQNFRKRMHSKSRQSGKLKSKSRMTQKYSDAGVAVSERLARRR